MALVQVPVQVVHQLVKGSVKTTNSKMHMPGLLCSNQVCHHQFFKRSVAR